jgi:hypothetical protein|tara:strand:- start:123 stop:554 length:432 start_codon:yes stop_codon:yes gene_type:complete
MSEYRVGHHFLVGKTTLKTMTIIDVLIHNHSFQVVDEEGNIKDDFRVDDEDLFAYCTNKINQPETQNAEGRFTVEGDEDETHIPRWECGQKVEFEVELKGALLKVEGFITRNFWNSYYLLSEVGVSVPNRYWKVAHSKCTKIA